MNFENIPQGENKSEEYKDLIIKIKELQHYLRVDPHPADAKVMEELTEKLKSLEDDMEEFRFDECEISSFDKLYTLIKHIAPITSRSGRELDSDYLIKTIEMIKKKNIEVSNESDLVDMSYVTSSLGLRKAVKNLLLK